MHPERELLPAHVRAFIAELEVWATTLRPIS